MDRWSTTRALMVLAAVALWTWTVPLHGQGDQSARAAIEAANKKFVAAAAKGDAAGMAAQYDANGAAYPANSDVVKGRSALQAFWKSVLDSGISDVTLNTTQVDSSGDLAVETGNYVLMTKDGTVADRGKYVVVWKRSKGQWAMQHDIWTTSMPAKK